MILKNAKLQARKTPNSKGQKGNHLVYQITIPNDIIYETGWKKGEKINILANGERAVFEGVSFSNPDKMNEDSLKKGLSNLGEHENLPDRLRIIEKDIRFLKIHHWLNFIFLMITIWIFIVLGVMLL